MPEPPPTDPILPRPALPPRWRDRARAAFDAAGLAGRPPAGLVAAAVAVLAVLGGAAFGAYLLLRPPAPPPEITLPMAGTDADPAGPTSSATVAATTVPDEVVVHAAGAVARPGLYRLPAGSRVADLVDAAGGLAPGADADRINLAAPLEDGQRVYIPRAGEAIPPENPVAGGPGPDGGGTPSALEPLDLNQATVDELDTLPGIGPTIAGAIVRYRDEHGPFRSVEQLLDVPGIGEAKLAQLRDLVRVG